MMIHTKRKIHIQEKSSFNEGSDENNRVGFSLYYKTNNGTGTEYEVYWDIGKNSNRPCGQASGSGATVTMATAYMNKTGSGTAKATLPGFPTKLYAVCDNATVGAGSYNITSIVVNNTTIWAGTIHMDSSYKQKYGTLTSGYNWSSNDSSNASCSTSTKNWVYPYADKIMWGTTGNPSDVTTPTSDSVYTRSVSSYCVDQYGVRLAADPTYSFSCSGDTTSKTGISATSSHGTTSSTYTISVNKDALLATQGYNYRTVTVKAAYSFGGKTASKSNNSNTSTINKTFKVTDPAYTITFDKNGSGATTLVPSSSKVYYGESLNSQQTYNSTHSSFGSTQLYPTSGTWTGHTWLGMFESSDNNSALMNPDKVLNSATKYYAHWDSNTYTVVFLGRTGNYIDVQYVSHGGNADTESVTKKLNKYELQEGNEETHWVLNESNPWSPSVNNVTKDIMTTAQYTLENHNFGAVENMEADCLHGAGTKQVCKDCGYEKIITQDDKLGDHTKSEAMNVEQLPTCTANGYGIYYCTVCGSGEWEEEIPALGHSFTHKVTKEATCSEEGVMTYTCTRCEHSETEAIAKLQHNYQAGASYPATCETSGYTEMVCSGCGDKYKRYDGVADPEDHIWQYEVSEPSHGIITVTGTCDVCRATFEKQVESTHKFSNVTTSDYVAPKCNAAGSIKLNCGVEGCTENHTITIPKTDVHNYTTTVKNADCKNAGSVVNTCQDCGDTKTVATLNALGHSYNDGVVTTEANCTEKGVRTYTCSRCGDTKTADIPVTGHKTVTVAPTCTTDGYEKCGVCQQIINTTKATGHNFTNWSDLVKSSCVVKGVKTRTCISCNHTEIDVAQTLGDHTWNNFYTIDYDSTCATEGQKSIHCAVCGQIKEDSEETIEKKAHAMGETETVLEATCTGKGITKTVCGNCGYTVTAETDALGHAYEKTSETNATCTTDGELVETCSNCNDVKKTVIPKTGHHYVAGTPVAATCKDAGHVTMTCACGDKYEKYTGAPTLNHDWQVTSTTTHDKTTITSKCSICGAEVTQEIAGSHKFTKGEVTTTPTCTTDGIVTVKCEVEGCGESYTINIGKGGHKIETQVTEPNCETAGKAVSYCTTCNTEIDSKEIKAKGHSYTAEITKAATCTAKGVITYTCACGYKYTGEIEKNPNAHEFKKNGETVKATCTSPAYDEYKCACGKTYKEYSGEALGHKYTTTSTQSGTTLTVTCECSACHDKHEYKTSVAEGHNYSVATVTKQPTCYTKGEVNISCDKAHDANCDSSIKVELAVNSEAHNFNTTYNYPTCEVEGSVVTACENGCGYTSTAKLSALGHEWDDGAVTTDPTCTTDGEKTFACTRTGCDETRTEVIAKTGHSWNDGTNHAADCTHGQYTQYECTVCHETYDAVVDGAKALGHKWDDGEVTTEPTCTTDGEKTFACTRKDCGETRTEPIGKLGHNFVAGTKHEATCDTAAYTEYKCNNSGCTLSYNEYKGNALGHDWGEWTVTTPATNTTDGLMTRTCSRDSGHTETVTIPKGGHTFDTKNPTTKTAATCTTEGEQTFACTAHSDCGVTLTVTTAKIQHELTTVHTEANCTTGGSVVTTCENCDYKDTITLPSLGHDYVKGTHVDATCTSSGYDVYTCSRCDDVKNVISENAKEHSYTKVADKSEDATCTESGHVYMACSCGAHYEYDVPAKGHDYTESLKQSATCTQPEIKTYTCSCGDSYDRITAVPKDHTWGEWTVKTPATENTVGVQERTCTCGAKETAPIPATGAHVMSEDTTQYIAPTCETEGKRVFTCQTHNNCTADYTETIAALGHNGSLNYQAATCTADGYSKLICSRDDCGKELDSKTIPMLKHNYAETSRTYPTCTVDGAINYKCSNCDATTSIALDKTGTHKLQLTETVASTCTAQGYDLYSCEDCDYTCKTNLQPLTSHEADDSKTETVEATCASIGYKKSICSCGAIISVETIPVTDTHDWKTKTAEGSGCLKSGYSYSECSVCGKIKDITVTDSADHTYTQKVKTAATCTAGGEIEIYCTTCEVVVQTVTTSPLGHDFSGEPTVTPATCKNMGSVVYSCQRTDCDEKLTYTLDRTPHSYVLKNTVAATCTQGSYELFECEDCGSLMKNVTSSANGHSYEADPSNADVEATCCAEGHVYRKCKNCDAKYDYVVPATGEHTYDDGTVTQEATCLKSEITEYKCTTDGCSASYIEVTADAKGHNYTDWTYAHMTATGKCACGDTITVNIPDSATHSWVYDKISSPATCKTKGYIQFKCEVEGCDATLYREYGPIDGAHVWNDGETTTEATCTTDGVKTYTCTKCNTTKTETIAKLGHEHTSLVEKVDPTCTTNGYVTYKCIRCDDKVTSIIEKNADNHKFVTVTVDPTCLEDGYTVETCEYCGHEGTKTVNENTALGHHEVTNETKATCVKAGSKITYCDRCNTIIKTESSAALGHDENRTNITPATCEGTGKDHVTCSRCDYEADETVDALGHDWNDGEIIVTGNCETQQVTRYTCKRCGDTKDVLTGEIAKHNYEYKGVVTPTCTEKGYDKWVCSKCGDVNKRNLVDALGHDWGDWRIVSYPTETENGLQERFCQRDGCGAREEQIIIYGKFYLVTFYNYDGTRLMPPAYYEYGAPAIRPRKDPVKAADTAYTYEFIGWNYSDKQIGFVSERMAIIAQYAAHERYYDVTYKNEDGSVLATVKNVGFSQIAAKYPNPTPTKASDSSYDYTFGSWSINCDTNKGEAIATATYKSTPKKYEPPADTGSSSEENLFTRIINWIKNFFNKLFGRG